MLSSLFQGFLLTVVSWALWRIIRLYVVRSSLDNIPGPPSHSLWRGNMPELFSRYAWDFLDKIDKAGQPVARITGMFNKQALYIFDPKALHHIILKDQHVYQRASWAVALNRLTFGPGIFGTLDEQHRKQRKMLNPVFSINHMRHMTPVFYDTAHRLRRAVSSQLSYQNDGEVDMLQWMGRTALELIGQGGLGYAFDPLVANTHNSYGEALKAFLPTLGRCLNYRMLAHHHTKFGPASLRRKLLKLIPDQNVHALKTLVDTMHVRSTQILEGKRMALHTGDEAIKQQVGEGKDIMSILLRANMSSLEEDKLTEEELVAQMTSLVFAATDTTSNALSRILDLLTQHPDVQDKLRAEILEAGQGQDIPYDKLVDLPYLDAVCRETLRLYPPVPFVSRETRNDTILPLSEPIEGIDGTMMSEIVVPKGTMVVVAIRSCNRNQHIWGEDAAEWKPERWLDSVPSAVKEAKVPGVYANLMTFLGGGTSCIGFKFSQLEMKVILAVLMSSFKFGSTDKEVYWNSASLYNDCLMSPSLLEPKTKFWAIEKSAGTYRSHVGHAVSHAVSHSRTGSRFADETVSSLDMILVENGTSGLRTFCSDDNTMTVRTFTYNSESTTKLIAPSGIDLSSLEGPSAAYHTAHYSHVNGCQRQRQGSQFMLYSLCQYILVTAVSWVVWRIIRHYVVRSPLDNIPGPPSHSLWRGNLPELSGPHAWDLLDKIDRAGQPVARITGLLNKPALYVFDSKALHHIILKDQDVYQRTPWVVALSFLSFGPGIFGTLGEQHRKQRKMLNPVFSINHMRRITPIFYEIAHKLHKAVSNQLLNQPQAEIDMLQWMGRAALELIGQGGLGYSFDALVADTHDSFGEALKAFFPTVGRCLNYRLFAHHHTKLGPAFLKRWLLNLVPDRNIQDLKNSVDIMNTTSVEILENKRTALRMGDEVVKRQVGEGKDIMSVLMRANMSSSEHDKLTEEELLAQMTNLVLAATDTTSNALSRILDLLSKHPDVQDKLRAELLDAGQVQDIPYDKLVDLPYLDAVCRETLRLYAPVPFSLREARKTVVLPFSEPIQGTDGTMVSEIVVPKGTLVVVGIRSCNRNKQIWGEDAYEWKPERWLNSVPSAVKDAKVPGVYANLMTFLGGGTSCIGFKFSQLEMKVMLAVLIGSFKFSPTGKDVYWNSATVTYPTVGRESRKACLRAERIPLELWLHIIQCGGLDQQDICHLACVSKFLAWAAQPLLFTNFVVTQLCTKKDGKLVNCLPAHYHTRMLRRLEFVKSVRIAAAVKSVSIRFDPTELNPELDAIVDGDGILDEVFKSLSSFPNLKGLYARAVHFNPNRIAQLVELPTIEGLHFDNCSAAADMSLSSLQLRRLTLHGEIGGSKFGWWIPLLRSTTLTHLSYDAPSMAQMNADDPREDFLPALAIGPTMKSLRVLRLPGASPRFPCFVMALSKCPSVRELLIQTQFDRPTLHHQMMGPMGPLPAGVLPRLQALNAPYTFVERCLHNRPIKHITTSFDPRARMEIQLSLLRLHHPQLEEIAVTAHQRLVQQVLPLLVGFRRLRGLYLVSTAPCFYKETLDFLRGADYPQTLRSLHIYCYTDPREIERTQKTRRVAKERKSLVQHLRRLCPEIVDISISVHTEDIVWKDPYTNTPKWYEWSDYGLGPNVTVEDVDEASSGGGYTMVPRAIRAGDPSVSPSF
ncbi:hypothetical protein NM688_g4887 [Phlebia brevispora]|uniref:Uncharacterized protein n=1 Tax=Phlebia brevispora TaxID=194682 RepID=A0ACC1T1U3_9APHY|nr:hypothetical protein NM688_g4887 [Phlebia brevispora]